MKSQYKDVVDAFAKITCHPYAVGLICFGVLAILNSAYLFNPPYWDDIFSPHNQALWLRNNNFNLFKLWREGGDFWNGGSNVYPFSLTALFYALLYSMFSPLIVHLLGHLINIACISAAFALTYTLICRFQKSKTIALLWCSAALFEPVMAGRTAALGRESILGLVIIFTIYLMMKKHYWTALVMIILSFFIKPTGILLSCTMAAYLLALYLLKSDFFNFRKHRAFIFTFLGSFLIIIFLYKITSSAQGGAFLKLGSLTSNMKFCLTVMMPFAPFLISAVVALALFKAYRLTFKTGKFSKPAINLEISVLLFTLTFICGFWTAFMIFKMPLPRYTAITIFPIFAFLGISIKNNKAAIAASVIFSAVSFYCWHGNHLPALPNNCARSGDMLERSREYLQDIEGNKEICTLLETYFAEHPIVAKGPFLQMLTIPEYRYVKRPLKNVISASVMPPLYCPVSIYNPDKISPKALYIYSRNVCEYGMNDYSLIPFQGDKILMQQGEMPAINVIYQKRPSRRILILKELSRYFEQKAQSKQSRK